MSQDSNASVRKVARIVTSIRTREGGGFIVHRPFPTQTLMDFDPFLLLDEMGPVDYAPGEAVGAPDHPHRGFETAVDTSLATIVTFGDWQFHEVPDLWFQRDYLPHLQTR